MKLTKRILSLALAAAVTAGMTAGCSGGGGTDTTAATEGASSAAVTEAQSEAAENESAETESGGAIQQGGSLVIAIPQVQNTFFMPQSTTTSDRFGAQPVLESLGRADAEGNYYPWLAEEFITDAENLHSFAATYVRL